MCIRDRAPAQPAALPIAHQSGVPGAGTGKSVPRIAAARQRLSLIHILTDPVVDFYRNRGVLSEIDGTASIENATAEILKILEG